MTFHFLAQMQLRVAVPLKKMWRVCESRFEGLAARIRSAGDAWDYGDPGMTGVIGWGEFRGFRLFGGYVGSGENGALRCACHAMGVESHPDASLVVPRVRTVVRGERASRSIVNRTTALWSIWIVASLIVAGSGIAPF